MRAHAAVLLVALVVLGGCLGGASLDSQAETTTAAPNASTATSTVPGTTADGSQPALVREAEGHNERLNVTQNATFVVDDGSNVTVSMAVANSAEERRQGLMFVTSLPRNHGMVFVYPDAEHRTFWMKNTYVPLDMVFVAPNGTVLNVEHADTQLNASTSELDRYSSEGDAKYVVELPRGFANRTGVGPGTQLRFNGSAPSAESSG
ncbi:MULTISPECIES: DUF192 domain-containing protein [Halorussus]|uniref:DUF192 domain-containing protein n=1 Tax=Halorussus TaxID=1070314 RepID=UPI0020A18363|nr:DUF192 domain-containing protein [Halorussus vallis]USZ78176.1 DUF192 domain-containing protein [Halorussus vallis]